MDSSGGPSASFLPSAEESLDCPPAPDSSRHTTHDGNASGLSSLSYGVGVAWHQLRPFLPFFLISFMIVALVYLMLAIIYGGPFKDPLFFVKFYERWPRPTPRQESPAKVFTTVPSPSVVQVLNGMLRLNNTS
ncbi:hypothetical protein AMECASPLE_033098 [Ameca splendens]|uniref:Uncharacterized protein n=1 Tax=Ameca splendens TaxID=208324 RepID=A0ABV0ZRL1_9TELE